MKILSVIPARGGSKSIPRKNILILAGKPLIAYTIENALQSKYINRVIVSTDDNEIASVSRKYGSEVIIRPESISGDAASSESALLHVLDYLDNLENYKPDLLVFLQCTSPLTTSGDIDGTIDSLIKNVSNTAFSATYFNYFIWEKCADGGVKGINHDKTIRQLRQERTDQYLETGAVYVMKVEGFKKARHRFFGTTSFYIMPNERSIEIDEPIDFKIAEILMYERQKNKFMPHKN
jgi:CMP-N-acetylneuraminic acid synthetase